MWVDQAQLPQLYANRTFQNTYQKKCQMFVYSGHALNMNITGLKIPTGGRQTSWLFTNMTEELNWGPPRNTYQNSTA